MVLDCVGRHDPGVGLPHDGPQWVSGLQTLPAVLCHTGAADGQSGRVMAEVASHLRVTAPRSQALCELTIHLAQCWVHGPQPLIHTYGCGYFYFYI